MTCEMCGHSSVTTITLWTKNNDGGEDKQKYQHCGHCGYAKVLR